MNLLDRVVAGTVPHLPRRLVGAVSRPYIAGETLDDALAVTRRLNEAGMATTMDLLGEHVSNQGQVDAAVAVYRQALSELARQGLDGNISVKLTHLGLKLDRPRCVQNVRSLVEAAAASKTMVRIDMEDSSTTSDTLEIYRELRETHDNVGVVLQAYLRRSEHDARELARMGARVRVCKGIYREPADIAFQDGDEINRSFLQLVEHLLQQGCHVGIATHDERLVNGAYRILETEGGCVGHYEFQMLLGVTERLRDGIVAAGHPLRVYVPFGAEWHAYSIRRLRENPQIAGHVFRAMFRKR
ncbi:MAG: proline dehydrogenase [Gemmatimonadota bacterium]|nr:MAG: proline dehydrogenase [Gemmatimonadota bacterium]